MAWKCVVMILSVLAAMAVNGGLSAEDEVQAFVDSINSQQSTWTAKKRDITGLKNLLQNRMGAEIHERAMMDPTIRRYEIQTTNSYMPPTYDTSKEYPECNIHSVKHQYECGSCWAVTSAGVMQDRLCIHSHGQIKVNISAAHLAACCKTCGFGCGGGAAIFAFSFMMRHGVVTGGEYNSNDILPNMFWKPWLPLEALNSWLPKPVRQDRKQSCRKFKGCFPYPLCEYCNVPPDRFDCPSSCPNENYPKDMESDKYYVEQIRLVKGGASNIQYELFTNGPVAAIVSVYDDFMYYDSGIYQHTQGNFIQEHYVRLIGYGTENGVDYWIGVNSWSDWGEQGTFRIRRGVNESGIEKVVLACIPDLTRCQ